MAKKFAEHNGLNLVEVNKSVLEEWKKNDIFHKSIDERDGNPQFIFFEGPPSANGHPGIHHVLHVPSRIHSIAIRPCRECRYTARQDGTLMDFL